MFDDKTVVDPSGLRHQIAARMDPQATLDKAIQLEVILAQVQARHGVIPNSAARDIARTATTTPPSVRSVKDHLARTGHPMVAILDAFSENMPAEAAEWLHFGTTTADIFRTVRMVQIHAVAEDFLIAMREIEGEMAALAGDNRATPMIGRTLGRHAMPITFGYKVAIWMRDTRRCIDRLKDWQNRYQSGVLSGAVGTHSVLGHKGPPVEAEVMKKLGLGTPDPADSKGSTDVFAEFASALAIAARVFGRIAQEVFLLQGDDIRELSVTTTAVGSSAMPHKSNPTVCIELMSRSREVAAALPIFLEWILIIHERDSAQHGAALENICVDMAQVLSCMTGLLQCLQIHPANMLHNLSRTKGAILTENVTIQMAQSLGRRSAHHLMREATQTMARDGITLAEALAMDPRTAQLIVPPESEAIGLAPDLVDQTLRSLGYEAKDAPPLAEQSSR